jgi:hypothetical protein
MTTAAKTGQSHTTPRRNGVDQISHVARPRREDVVLREHPEWSASGTLVG